MVDQGGNLALDRIECCRIEQPCLADAAAEMFQAIALLAQAPDLVLAAIELRVARVGAVETAGVDLDRARSLAGAGAFATAA